MTSHLVSSAPHHLPEYITLWKQTKEWDERYFHDCITECVWLAEALGQLFRS